MIKSGMRKEDKMDLKDILKNRTMAVLFIIFSVLASADIIYSSIVQRAVTFDGSIWFAYTIDQLSNGADYAYKSEWGVRPRDFINILHASFVNAAYALGVKSKYWLAVMYSVPHFLFNFLILAWQFMLSLRSKRFDIFISALILYALFIVPVSYYPICEICLALSLALMLFHYLCADIKYKIYDFIIILFLLSSIYLSTEAYLYIGVIMFAASIYYASKAESEKSKFVKYLIGVSCLNSVFFQIGFYNMTQLHYVNSERASSELNNIKEYLRSFMFAADLIFFAAASVCLFKKTKIKAVSFIFLAVLSAAISFVYIHNSFYLELNSELFVRRFFPYIAAPVLMIINILFDINKDKFSSEKINAVMYNLCVLFLFAGCSYLTVSLFDADSFKKAVNELKRETSQFENTIIMPERHIRNFYQSRLWKHYFYCSTYTYDYINFTEKYKLDSIAAADFTDEHCPKRLYFKDNYLVLPYDYLGIKNEFWDLTEVKDLIENNKELKTIFNPDNFSEFDNMIYNAPENTAD